MFLGEVCIALVVLTLYRLESHGDVLAFLSSRPGLLCAAGVLGFVVSVGVILYQFQKHRLAEGKQFIKIGMMNLVVVIFTMVPAELALRVLSEHSPGVTLLGRTLLYPRSWSFTLDMKSHEMKFSPKTVKRYIVRSSGPLSVR
jgi:hypothetical protein